MLHASATAAAELERRLATARHDVRHEADFYAALLAGKVFVVDCELVLGEQGPCVELQPRVEGDCRVLVMYTSRRHLPAGVDPLDAPSMPFTAVLRAMGDDVEVALDPGTTLARRMEAVELELLRRVLAPR